MIKFFRSIRKNLLNEGKTTKYFKYAIGEIVLVVIGILIALQINTWNQGRLILNDQIAVLKKLERDLDGDYQRFMLIDSYYVSDLNELKHQKELVFKTHLTDDEVKKIMFFKGASFHELKPRRTAYDEMINSGRLYNLSNDTLVDQIIDYYKNVEDDIYQIHETRREFRTSFYSNDLSEYWHWQGENNSYAYAYDFFNNQNTNAFKLVKQAVNWSDFIVKKNLEDNTKLLKQNRALKQKINSELQLID